MSPRQPTKTPLGDRLAELTAAAVAANVHLREVQTEHERARAETEQLREQIVELFAAGRDKEAGELQARREEAEQQAAAGTWDEKIAGAERAARRAMAEKDAFTATNYAGLVRERAPRALKAAERIENALRELIEAPKEWHAEEGEQTALVRPVPGGSSRSIPRIDQVDQLARDARRLVGTVKPPLPRELSHVAIAPEPVGGRS